MLKIWQKKETLPIISMPLWWFQQDRVRVRPEEQGEAGMEWERVWKAVTSDLVRGQMVRKHHSRVKDTDLVSQSFSYERM